MNPILACMSAHRSVRTYVGEGPSDDEVIEAFRAAQFASTSSNLQGYCALRVRDAERRKTLAELCGGQAQVESAGAFFAICGETRRHILAAEKAGLPHVDSFETFLLSVIDASLFAQNLVLAFESMGYGICYIGGLRNRIPEVDRLLEVPRHVFPLFGLCVGKPAEDPGQRPRMAAETLLYEERFPTDDEQRAAIESYDETMREYYDKRGKPGYDWSGGTARKFRKPLRAELRAYYEAKGASFE